MSSRWTRWFGGLTEGIPALGYLAGWRLVRALPEPVATSLFRLGADLAVRRSRQTGNAGLRDSSRAGPSHGSPAQGSPVQGRPAQGRPVTGVARLRSNLRRVIGPGPAEEELNSLVRAGMRSYARYWKEAFRLPSIPAERVISTMCLDGADLLDRLYAEGRGVVVALAHSGNWDHAGAWAALTGKPVVTVAERLKPESLYHRFLDYRASIGIEAIPLTGGTKPPLDALEDRLRAGGLVCLLADRDLSRRGIEVSFFGGRARMPAGPALLALRSGAPLLVCQLWYDGPVSRGRLIGPLPIPAEGSLTERTAALTQAIAVIFEEGIRAHPQDWHMLQRLWIDEDLAGEGPAGEGPAGEGSGVAR